MNIDQINGSILVVFAILLSGAYVQRFGWKKFWKELF